MVCPKWNEKKQFKIPGDGVGKKQRSRAGVQMWWVPNSNIQNNGTSRRNWIDDKLNFENHIAKICRKVSQKIAVLKRMQKLLPFETRSDIYKAFILPHVNYCSETWHFCSKNSADKLEMVNKRALRFVLGKSPCLMSTGSWVTRVPYVNMTEPP